MPTRSRALQMCCPDAEQASRDTYGDSGLIYTSINGVAGICPHLQQLLSNFDGGAVAGIAKTQP